MPRKAFTVVEANTLIPALERALAEIAAHMERVRVNAERLQVLDLLWGDRLLASDNPDYREAQRFRSEIAAWMAQIEAIVELQIHGRGLRFPQGGLEHGLIDFPTTWEGRWVYLCWRRGESEVLAWHELSGGFAGRRPLTREQTRRMGREGTPAEREGPLPEN